MKTSNSSGCPVCSNRVLLTGFNDLGTRFPEVAKEWDYTRNGGLTPQDVVFGTNAYCDWKCAKGHQWRARASRRAVKRESRRNCPECTIVQGSLIESAFRKAFTKVSSLHDVLEEGKKYPLEWRKRKFVTVDIYGVHSVSKRSVAIEYDGVFYHSDTDGSTKRLDRDIDKTTALLKHGFLVIRIRENDLPLLKIKHDHLLQLPYRYSLHEEDITKLVARVEEWLLGREFA